MSRRGSCRREWASNLNDDELDLLLSGGALRGPAADALETRILKGLSPRWSWRRNVGLKLAAMLVPSFAAFALAWSHFGSRPVAGPKEGFRAKGAADDGATIGLYCSGGPASACPMGSRVAFVTTGRASPQFVAAFATSPSKPEERIWYFMDGGPPAVFPPGESRQVLSSRAVVLSDEHDPGDYLVHVLTSDVPLSRKDILTRALDVGGFVVLPLRVIPAAH